MNGLFIIPLTAGETGTTLSTTFAFTTVPINLTIVAVACSPNVDDSGLTIDINDDGSAAIDGVDCSDQDVPGTWLSTHMGGTNVPVNVAAGSKLSLDANNAAANTMVTVLIYCLPGVIHS